MMRFLSDEVVEKTNKAIAEAKHPLIVEAQVFYEDGLGVSCSHLNTGHGTIRTQGWVIGVDEEEKAPEFCREFSAVHALHLVKEYLQEGKTNPDIIMVKAGDGQLCAHLYEWCNTGKVMLKSLAAPRVLQLWTELASTIPCPLI